MDGQELLRVGVLPVLRAVDDGSIDPQRLPPTPWLTNRLTDAQGLVRPDVKREEINTFKLSIRPPPPGNVDPATLMRERQNLMARRSRLIEGLIRAG